MRLMIRRFLRRVLRSEEKVFQDSLSAIQENGESLEDVLKRYPEEESELRPRLTKAVWLRGQANDLSHRPGFLEASRRRLVNRIALDSSPASFLQRLVWRGSVQRQQKFRWAVNSLALLVLAYSIFSLGSRTVSWAQTSLPGDGVYLVKLLVEDVRLGLTFDPAAKAKLHIDFAQERSNEIQALILEDRYEQIPISAVDFLSQVYQAKQALETIRAEEQTSVAVLSEQLNAIIADQYVVLNFLIEVVPAHARSAIEQAMIVAP
jgi:hypothetical protein